MGRRELQPLRREMQMIFQDPYASLNPRKRIGQIVGGPLQLHGLAEGKQLRLQVEELLDRVGLAGEHYNRFPHEFSGGQRQRIGIARALALRPKLIIADEPVSALDVSIQAQIINLLEDLQDEFDLTYIFVAHDLGVVRHVADRVAVMYLGKIVEIGPADEVYANPVHPYTEALLSAVPIPDPKTNAQRTERVLEGDVPVAGEPARGVPVPHPLPVRDRDLLRGRADAGGAPPAPVGSLPPPAERGRGVADRRPRGARAASVRAAISTRFWSGSRKVMCSPSLAIWTPASSRPAAAWSTAAAERSRSSNECRPGRSGGAGGAPAECQVLAPMWWW